MRRRKIRKRGGNKIAKEKERKDKILFYNQEPWIKFVFLYH